MNSYNENLHSTVVATLAAQELELETMKASLDASMFTLYYAGGARMTASERLAAAREYRDQQSALKEQAVINNNIAVNLLTSANQEKQYVAQSVTDISVAAANIQAASNAVLKLAGNMGSVFSMVGAADFGSDIYGPSAEAHRLMNQTAYDAERTSEKAMEASTLMAEVSSGLVADEAKSNGAAIGGLYSILSASYDAAMAVVANDNAVLATASADEKKAEGNLEAINVDYFATRRGYMLNNGELNINLCVPAPLITKDSYTVTFDYYKSAFPKKETLPGSETGSTSDVADQDGYPVQNYYIILVKDNQKTIFSLANAESIIATAPQEKRYRVIPGTHVDTDGIKEKLFITDLLDSDGNKMVLGVKYVVFVLAEFMTSYKKNINDFSDYLSAPSAMFNLSNFLSSPIPSRDNIVVKDNVLSFHVKEYQSYRVKYRCMLLPITSSLVKGLLSEQGLRTIEGEVERMERIAELYDPKIMELEVQIASLQSDYDSYDTQLQTVKDELKKDPTNKKLQEEARVLEEQLDETGSALLDKHADLQTNMTDKANAMSHIDPNVESKPGFFFNLTVAEQVAPANYSYALELVDDDGKEKGKGKDKDKDKNRDKSGKEEKYYMLELDDTITDNYGNLLIEGNSYIPVILSVASPEGQDVSQFTNSLSMYASDKQQHFVFNGFGNVPEAETEE